MVFPRKIRQGIQQLNDEFLALKGELDDKEAKISLAKFLRANLGFTTELISGIKLAAYQEATLKGMMNRNFSMCVWGRGCGKTLLRRYFVSFNASLSMAKNTDCWSDVSYCEVYFQ